MSVELTQYIKISTDNWEGELERENETYNNTLATLTHKHYSWSLIICDFMTQAHERKHFNHQIAVYTYTIVYMYLKCIYV